MINHTPARPRSLSFLKVITMTLAVFSGATVRSEDAPTHQLSIPSLPLAAALLEFSIQTEVGLAMDESTRNATQLAPPLEGNFSAAAALEQLLSGTDLRATWVDGENVSIMQDRHPSRDDDMGAVAVTGARLSYGGSAPIRVYSREQIEQLGVSSLPALAVFLKRGRVIPGAHPADAPQDSEIRNDEPATEPAR